MFTWVLASRGAKPLAVLYLTIAAVALLVAATTSLVAASHHGGRETTLQLNITNRR